MVEQRSAVVIEDEADIRRLLETTLSQAGFAVHSASSGREGIALVRAVDPTVTTLDIALPDIDGFEVARQLRAFSGTYLVMLTGRAEEIDTLLGLEAGADDYVTKPFRPRELRARIEAMLRRPRDRIAAPGTVSSGAEGHTPPAARGGDVAVSADMAGHRTLVHGDLVVDVDCRTAEVGGVVVDLTRTEFELLAAILEAPRRVITKEVLARRALGGDHLAIGPAERRSVEVHIANVRRKLGDDPAMPRHVETVRGVGYRLARLS